MADQERKYTDGNYDMMDLSDAIDNSHFTNEKHLCDFIEANIIQFCEESLGVKYKSHIREKSLSDLTSKRSIKGNKRIDFLIITADNQRIGVECKNPKYSSELSYAVGQCLTYMTLFERMGQPLGRMFIVATKLERSLPFTIDRFNLPIGFIVMDLDKTLTFRNGSTKGK